MSSTIDRSLVRREISAKSSLGRVRKPLLACGIAASLLYGAMIWVIRYEGYSPISQTPSELSAWGVSTRPLWMVLGSLYDALMIAFALGVWASASGKRTLRILGGLLLAYGLLGLAWPFASMVTRARAPTPGSRRRRGDASRHRTPGSRRDDGCTDVCSFGIRGCGVRSAVPHLFDRHDRDPPRIRRLDVLERSSGGCEPADAVGRALGAHQHRRLLDLGCGGGCRSLAHSSRRQPEP
jgi:hypothetical protein